MFRKLPPQHTVIASTDFVISRTFLLSCVLRGIKSKWKITQWSPLLHGYRTFCFGELQRIKKYTETFEFDEKVAAAGSLVVPEVFCARRCRVWFLLFTVIWACRRNLTKKRRCFLNCRSWVAPRTLQSIKKSDSDLFSRKTRDISSSCKELWWTSECA